MGSDSPLIERLSAWVLEQLSVGVVFIDRDGVIIGANSRVAQITGVDQSCIKDRLFYDQPEFQKAKLAEAVHSVMAVERHGKAPKPTIRINSSFGNKYRVEILPIVVGQKVLAAAILFWDVVDTSSNGTEVERLRQRLASVLALAEDEVIIIDQDFAILEASQSALKRLKLTSAGQLEGKVCYHAIFGEEKPCDYCPAAFSWREATTQRKPQATQRKAPAGPTGLKAVPIDDGGHTRSQVAVNCIRALNGKLEKPTASGKGKYQAPPQELSELSALCHLGTGIFEALPHAAIVVDSEYNILSCNSAGRQLFGHARADLIGSCLFQMLHEFAGEEFRKSLQQCLKTGSAITTVGKSAAPESRAIEALKHTITRLPAVAGVEGALILSEKVAESPNGNSDKHLAEKYDTLCRFASRLSHDINNPLGVLMNQLEMLRGEDLSDENSLERLQNEIDLAQRQVNRICTIIESVAALQSHSREDVTLTNLQLIIDRAAIIANLHRPFKGVIIEMAEAGNLPPIYCCEVRIERALTELCKNALEAAGETGKVLVSVEYVEESEQFVIRISDTGVGIPAENMGKVFDAFFTTKKKGPKTVGLGLTIAMAAIVSHNGSLTLKSQPPKGTEAVVILPQAPTDGFPKP